MNLYTVKYDTGYMSIIKAEDIDQAWGKAERKAEQQEWEVKDVYRASEEDISWVEGMGGYIPKL